MDFRFSEYKIKLLSKPFLQKNSCIAAQNTALLSFFDEKNKLIFEKEFAFISPNDIRKNKCLAFDQCFLPEECFAAIKENIEKLSDNDNFSIKHSFITAKKIIDFSEIYLKVREIDFKENVFYAPVIQFNNASLNASDIDFSDCKFIAKEVNFYKTQLTAKHIKFSNSYFAESEKNFREIKLISENVEFKNINFNDGDAIFTGSDFGNGIVSFKISDFGSGKVDFSQTSFGGEEISFEKVNFGEGDVSFRNAVFKDGRVNFISSVFGVGDKSFVGTKFGNGNVIFKNSKFSDGKVRFRMANFGIGRIDFHFSEFGKGDFLFDRVHTMTGSIDFRAVDFGTGMVRFKNLSVEDGDIIFENAKLEGNFYILDTVLGKGVVTFDEASFEKAKLFIENVDFGTGKVSFNKAKFDELSLRNSQLDNFFDLRLKSCNMLDLSNTVVKDILNIDSEGFSSNLKGLNLAGMRLLGRIYLDWKRTQVSKLIYEQNTGNAIKAEQFRILKENYNATGQYNYEDEAYVEFKRAEAKAFLEDDLQGNWFAKTKAWIKYGFERLIFDRMGAYATDPLRVLITMIVTYIIFSLVFLFISEFGDAQIVSALYEDSDTRVLGTVQKAFYHSAITFLTIGYGDYYPEGIARWLSGIEGFVGLFMMSYFTVAFVRKVLR